MGSESYHERLAFAVVGAVLDVTVEPYDRNGRQRAVDAILHYADGKKAALEVSSISPITRRVSSTISEIGDTPGASPE